MFTFSVPHSVAPQFNVVRSFLKWWKCFRIWKLNMATVCVRQHLVLLLSEAQGHLFLSSKRIFHNGFVHVCFMCLLLWFVNFYLFIYLFFLWCQDSAVFTNINYIDLGGPGMHGECYSPLSSIFIFCHFTLLQLPDAGDGGRQVNRYGVETADQFTPERTKGSSLGHQGFFFFHRQVLPRGLGTWILPVSSLLAQPDE